MQKLIDNNRLTLLETIKSLAPDFDEISIATGYWDLQSIDLLLKELSGFKKIRLLIGKEPLIPRYGQNQIEEDYPKEDIKYDLAQLKQSDKNKELRTGSPNDSCILKSNWIKRDITDCADDVTGLCGRYIKKDISGDISDDVDTIKIDPTGTIDAELK